MRHFKIPLLVIALVAVICGVSYFKYNVAHEKTVETMGTATSSKVIIVDPGHGGFDPGKPGINGEDEKDLNLKIALKLRDYLEQSGAMVVMTRTTDNDVDGMEGVKHKSKDMAQRKQMAADGDIVVSIHQNSFSQPSVRGAQAFYSKKSEHGKALATLIQRSIKENADTENRREAKSNANYYVLKAIEIPSVIVECGFLTNSEEEAKLNDDLYQDKMAWSIYLGIVRYFEGVEQ
nr:N-acetylmuramoyl-L-alanine amidase [uncultured Cellulosilyticum sp.]